MLWLNTVGYLSSWDGKVSKLVVQATDEIYDNNITSTYRRTFIRNIAPMYLRLANWPFNHVDPNNNDGKPTNEGKMSRRLPYWHANTLTDMPILCLKWFITSLVITFVVCCSADIH